MQIVAYATAGPYEREAERLARSAHKLNLPFHLDIITHTFDDWTDAVRLKPRLLLGWRAQFAGEDVLYVDVDAVFHADPRPYLPTGGCDFGIHQFFDGQWMTGTIFLPADGRLTEDILLNWIARDAKAPDPGQPQRVLARLFEERPDWHIFKLPPELCWHFDIGPIEYGKRAVVIEHLMASREYRRPGQGQASLLDSRRQRIKEIDNDRAKGM